MGNVIRTGTCGNSPKDAFAEEFAVALVTANSDVLSSGLTESAVWTSLGDEEGCSGPTAPAVGHRAILEATKRSVLPTFTELRVLHAFTHGRMAAVDCEIAFPGHRWADFCLIIEFKGAKGDKVAAFKSYFAVRRLS